MCDLSAILSIAISYEIFIFLCTYIHVYPCIDSKRDLMRVVNVLEWRQTTTGFEYRYVFGGKDLSRSI